MTQELTPFPHPPGGLWDQWGTGRLLLWTAVCLVGNVLVQGVVFALTGDLFVSAGAGAVIAVLVPCRAVARALHGTLASEFALRRVPPAVLIWTAVAAAASLAPTSELAGLSQRITPLPSDWVDLYAKHLPRSPAAIAVAYAVVAVIVPPAEEILFRGLLQRIAARFWGTVPAVVLAALVFALLHGEPWFLFGLAGLGLLLGFLFATTRSLVPGIVAHGLHNAVALTALLREGPQAAAAGDGSTPAWLLPASIAALALACWRIARLGRRRS